MGVYKWPEQADYEYVAYVDESGDPGLSKVKPLDYHGSSEWLILGATVVSRENEAKVAGWVRDTTKDFRGHQRVGFHFSDLNPAKRSLVCSKIATLPVRCFAIASNKKNMRGYENPYASKLSDKNWFYCWLTRLLLERITLFVKQHSTEKFGEPKRLKIEYSNRGGLSYSQMNAYYSWLKHTEQDGRLYLPQGTLCWDVMDPSLLEVHGHQEHAGLHFADAVASAFFKACDKHDTGSCDPQFAQILKPKMARQPDRRDGQVAGFGVKIMPGFTKAKLDADQQTIFRYYGYPKSWWGPGPE